MPKKPKIVYEKDDFIIQFIELTHSDGRYFEHRVVGKYRAKKGKLHEIFKIRVMDNKRGGVGYIVVLNHINWQTGEALKRKEGFIIETDRDLLDRVEYLNRELLDRLHAEVLASKMKSN